MGIQHRELSYLRAYYLCAYKAPSTSVENSLQISSFMQNKANFRKVKTYASSVRTKDYENLWLYKSLKNKPNSNPIKANTKPIQTQLKQKQTQTKPIQTQTNPISNVTSKNGVSRVNS